MKGSLKSRIGVAADDITGSNDVGVMFAKNGYRVKVISLVDKPCDRDFEDCDVLVINTSSRLDSAREAYRKTAEAVGLLKKADPRLLYIKTCSVFRGNIGASFDAAQDVLGAKTSMVVAAFPANGRTTEMGVHLLNGIPVAQTQFARDPVTPLRFSRLDELIGEQSLRSCTCFTYDLYAENDKQTLSDLRQGTAYVIFDARTQKELRHVAELIADEPLICGSSAICEELPKVWGEASEPLKYCPPSGLAAGAVVFAGSLTRETAGQVRYLIDRGICGERLRSCRLFTEEGRAEETQRVFEACASRLARGEDVLIHTVRDFENKSAARCECGIDDIEAGRRISLAFQMLARRFSTQAGISRFVVAGGETSDAVGRGLGLREMRIWQEIESGVPLMSATRPGGGEYALVFKSGSFGSEDFLSRALAYTTFCDENT